MSSELRSLYKDYIRFEKREFTKDVRYWLEIELPDKVIKKVYDVYYRPTFVEFVNFLKFVFFGKNVFTFLQRSDGNLWDLWYMLKFLVDANIILLKGNKTKVLRKDLLQTVVKPITRKEIVSKLREKIRVRMPLPVYSLFKGVTPFKWKWKYDQLPISTASAITLVERILENLPLHERFLFIGDDDFISILLGIVNPQIIMTVIDIDAQLLKCIDELASTFGLQIKTKLKDVEKDKLRGKNLGFLANPPYTIEGVKAFLRFGTATFGKDGGRALLVVGDEAIGTRALWLQKIFATNNLIIHELLPGCVSYPFRISYPEDKIVTQRLRKMGVPLKRKPRIFASLYVLDYIPWQAERIRFKAKLYSYI
jgi:hypothetical protein